VRGDEEVVLVVEEECAGAEGGPGASAVGGCGAEAEGPVGVRGGGDRVWVGFSCRRARIDPGRKREELVGRLEEVMRVCDRVAADPGGFEEVQLRALDVMIRAVRACYGMVADVEVDGLEGQVEELKAREAELRGGPGYSVEEPAG